jgi:GDPmannose 4,6-dehydratase
MTVALITGITGQDGAYLAELLLGKGYTVFGSYRRTSSLNFWRLETLGIEAHPNLKLVECDLTDQGSVIRLLMGSRPDELYNLAAQTDVAVSFCQPVATAQITALGSLNVLEAVRICAVPVRVFQAASSEMFGKVFETPQRETTPFYPRSPYAVSKLFAYWSAVNYREAFGLHVSIGILFNHESPLRGLEFVTRKITTAVAKIALGKQAILELGNVDSKRDWGYAREYVEGYWRSLQIDRPESFVFATGRHTSVREFTTMAFDAAGISVHWRGEGAEEEAICDASGRTLVRINPQFMRSAEVDLLLGDATKAGELLCWSATTTYEQLCRMMVEADLKRSAGQAGHR